MVAIIVTKSASMPSSCRGRYVHVAVCDVPYWLAWNPRWQPAQASARDRNVYRVIWDSGPVSVGKTARSASERAKARAAELASAWNNAKDMATAEQIIGAGGSA